jgi:ParB family chromosome partitioning protein
MAKLSLVNNPSKATMTNTGSREFAKLKLIDLIQTAEPFKTLFPINKELLNLIVADMNTNGFDKSQALILWKEQGVLLDGHTRLQAAKIAGLSQVPVVEKSFDSEEQALEYAIHLQRDRRNLTDSELYSYVLAVDSKDQRGGDRKSKSTSGLFDPDAEKQKKKSSRERTAEIAGTNAGKVQKIRTINEKAPLGIKEKVASGEMTINRAYTEIKNAKSSMPKSSKPGNKVNAESLNPSFSLFETLFQSIETIIRQNYQCKKALEQIVADLNYRRHISAGEMQELMAVVRK